MQQLAETHFRLIDELDVRQEAVLAQIDELNERIERLLAESSNQRDGELLSLATSKPNPLAEAA